MLEPALHSRLNLERLMYSAKISKDELRYLVECLNIATITARTVSDVSVPTDRARRILYLIDPNFHNERKQPRLMMILVHGC
jgi:hypothetical protein